MKAVACCERLVACTPGDVPPPAAGQVLLCQRPVCLLPLLLGLDVQLCGHQGDHVRVHCSALAHHQL